MMLNEDVIHYRQITHQSYQDTLVFFMEGRHSRRRTLYTNRLFMKLMQHIKNAAVLMIFLGVVITIFGTAATIRLYRSYDVGSKEYIMNRRNTGIILTDRHDRVFFTFNQPRLKTFVPLSEIPKHTQQAIIAAEDKGFFHHYGFSPRGILRSIYINYTIGGLEYGGSTITQQLVKNSYFSPQKSLTRKYKELVLAIKLEQYFSKKDILEMYMNSAYFGEGVFGIEEAAQTYFGKHASELSLAESSMIAGLLPAPSALSPLSDNFDRSKERQQFVLEQMRIAEYITEEQKQLASSEKLVLNHKGDSRNQYAPHFALMVRDHLIRTLGEEEATRSGLVVKTTLDLDWQIYLEEAMKKHVDSLRSQGVSNGAAVVLDPQTGGIVALTGSVSWYDEQSGKINMAIHPRQTGSTFKPIVYATAFEDRYLTPSSVILDIPRTYQTVSGSYRPANYDGRFRGRVLVRDALANSLNIPAVETTMQIGPARVVSMAKRLGITTLSEYAPKNLSLALGSEEIPLLELTAVYATFANKGAYNAPTAILEIRDKHNTIVPTTKDSSRQAMSEEVAFLISSILSDENARARTFGRSLTISRPAAVKTGTTQDYRDAWTVGYTPNLTVGVWLGNNDNTPMGKLPGSLGAAPLWRDLMERYSNELPQLAFTPPSRVIAVNVCRGSGLLTGNARGIGYTEYFIQGTEPTRYCTPPKPENSEEPPKDDPLLAQEEPKEEKKEKKPQPPKKTAAKEQEALPEPQETDI